MSIWICDPTRRRGAPLAAALASIVLLPGCLDGGTPKSLQGRPDVVALQSVTLGGGALVIDPPPGYCIDRASLNARPTEGFALIAACASLTGSVTGPDVEPALITVTAVSLAQPRAAPPGPPAIQQVDLRGSGPTAPAGEARHWRGALEAGGLLVGLALYAAPGSPLEGAEGQTLLADVAQRIQDRNATGARPVDSTRAPVPEEAVSEQAVTEKTGGAEQRTPRRLFGRLFR